MFSIYILTHNEEIDIAGCIESALLSDDVIVVDSYSSDSESLSSARGTAPIRESRQTTDVDVAFRPHEIRVGLSSRSG
jgi:hypothetical protein